MHRHFICFLFAESHEYVETGILELQQAKGLALVDILSHLQEQLLLVELDPMVLAFIIEKMADLEYGCTCQVHTYILSVLEGIHVLLDEVECTYRHRNYVLACYFLFFSLRHRLSVSTSEKIQLGSLVGIFVLAREKLQPPQ